MTLLTRPSYAIYLPAVDSTYAAEVRRELKPNRPFPAGLDLRDLIFWEPNRLWEYPYLLHSIGLYSVGNYPANAVTRRNRSNSILIGDSGGFQIGKGTLKGLRVLRDSPMPATDALNAWAQEFAARDWIIRWLDTYTDYAMTIDMPLWARTSGGKNSPFHHCSATQLIDMTVENLHLIDRRDTGRTKWVNIVQCGETMAETKQWWDAVKWFSKGAWAVSSSPSTKVEFETTLATVLMMRDDYAFEADNNWLHVLGVSTAEWGIMLSEMQRCLNKDNAALRVSYDSSTPFQDAGRFERVVLTPQFSNDKSSWVFRHEVAPQSILHVGAAGAKPFPHTQSPIGKLLMLNHLSVNGDRWSRRQYDSISMALLANHNAWVYLDAMVTANDLALDRDSARVPALYLERLDVIEEAFERETWASYMSKHESLWTAGK